MQKENSNRGRRLRQRRPQGRRGRKVAESVLSRSINTVDSHDIDGKSPWNLGAMLDAVAKAHGAAAIICALEVPVTHLLPGEASELIKRLA